MSFCLLHCTLHCISYALAGFDLDMPQGSEDAYPMHIGAFRTNYNSKEEKTCTLEVHAVTASCARPAKTLASKQRYNLLKQDRVSLTGGYQVL